MNVTPISVILCAAGSSSRMGRDKLTLRVGDMTVVEKAAAAFDAFFGTKRIIAAVSPGREEEFRAIFSAGKYRCVPEVCRGGSTRTESVRNALSMLEGEDGFVAVHDAARPFVSVGLIERTAAAAAVYGGAVPVLKVRDTVHTVSGGFFSGSLNREVLRAAQTPQIFGIRALCEAYSDAEKRGIAVTDDCGAVLAAGGTVAEVEGEERNIKITTPEDLKYINGGVIVRIGHGYDVHRLVTGRKLVIGGVEIPHTLGLLGHSDADVLVHAVADSLLGAAALGDIGRHFPDSDPAYSGISSIILLRRVRELVEARGFGVVNVDTTVCAQKPKLAPYIPAMIENISEALGIQRDFVSVKATTEEKLGFTGREEGISATAVCLLSGGADRRV